MYSNDPWPSFIVFSQPVVGYGSLPLMQARDPDPYNIEAPLMAIVCLIILPHLCYNHIEAMKMTPEIIVI